MRTIRHIDPRARASILAGLLSIALAACGGAAAVDPVTGSTGDATAAEPEAPASVASVEEPATSAPTTAEGGAADLEALTSTDWLGIVLGEVPTAECAHSTTFGPTDSCRWTTADGSGSVSVERSQSLEMPTLDAFKTRMTETLGVDEPIADLGEYALLGDDPLSGGIRIATWIGDGTHLWVVIAMEGDRQTLVASGANIAAGIIDGL